MDQRNKNKRTVSNNKRDIRPPERDSSVDDDEGYDVCAWIKPEQSRIAAINKNFGAMRLSGSIKGEQVMTVKFAFEVVTPLKAESSEPFGSAQISFFDNLLSSKFFKRFSEWANYRVNNVDIQVYVSLENTGFLSGKAPVVPNPLYEQMSRVALFEDSTSSSPPSFDGLSILSLPQAKIVPPSIADSTPNASVPLGGLAPLNDRIAKYKWMARTVNSKQFSSNGVLPLNTFLSVLAACYTDQNADPSQSVSLGFLSVRFTPSITFKGYYPAAI